MFLTGAWISFSLGAVAELKIADSLKDGPLSCEEIAQKLDLNADAVSRVFRMLSSVGIFEKKEGNKYGLCPVTELLRSDTPGTMRDYVRHCSCSDMVTPWLHLTEVLKTGKMAPPVCFGSDMFTYWMKPENAKGWEIFNGAMGALTNMGIPPVVQAVDFDGFKHICDVGGGHGELLAAIGKKAHDSQLTLFELKANVNGKVNRKIEGLVGDFFKDEIPRGCDLYIMKHILHDWDDGKCVEILKNISLAMTPGSKLAIVENLMPTTPEPSPAKFLDVHMMVVTGGRERSADEYAKLCSQAGIDFEKVVPTHSPLGVVFFTKK